MTDVCCDQCQGDLCPGDVFCGTCGKACDPDKARGFLTKRRIERGDTVEIDYDLVDSQGAPMNLAVSGVKVWFTVKYYLDDKDVKAAAQVTLAGGGIVTRDVLESGRIRVTLPPATTAAILEGTTRLYYDLQVLDAAGRVTTIEKGTFVVNPDVTRATS